MTIELQPTDPPEKPAGHPVARFWNWLKERTKEERKHEEEVARAVVRGASGAVISTGQTIAEGAAFVDRKTGLGEAIAPGFNASYDAQGGARGVAKGVTDPLRAAQDSFFGKRSDDRVAQFVEDTTQFLTSFAALGQVRVAAGGAKLAQMGWAAGLARGAVSDATAFDPYEAQLAELIARAPVPGLSDLFEGLSVQGDDSAAIARIKRSAAGAIFGTTIDGLMHGARILYARKGLASGKLTGAAKTQAETKIAESEKVLEAIEQGTSTPAAPITIRATSSMDDAWTLVTTKDSALDGVEVPIFTSKAEAQAQANSMNMALRDVDPESALKTSESVGATIYTKLRKFGEPGEVSDENLFQIAQEAMREIAPADRTRVLGELAQDAKIQSVVEAMAKAHSLNIGKRIADLDMLLESRPHDQVVQQEAMEKVQELMEFDDFRKWVQGERGRGLRIIGQQDNPLMEGVRQAQKTSMDPTLPPETRKAVRDVEEVAEAQDAIDSLLDEVEEGVSKNRTDTNAVTATDFSLARARKSAEAILEKLERGDKFFEVDDELAVKRAEGIKADADAQRADPLTVSPEQAAAAGNVKTRTSNPIEELSRWLDSADEGLERKLNPEPTPPKEHKQKAHDEVSPISEAQRRAKEGQKKLNELKSILKRANADLDRKLKANAERLPKEQKQKLYDEVSPISERLKRGTPEAQLKDKQDRARTSKVAGMTPRYAGKLAVDQANIRQITRMYRLAGGAPKDVTAAIQATNIIQRTGKIDKALEWFTNSLLSNPATAKTIFLSGRLVESFEALGRVGAGVATQNKALAQEGIDILYGNFAHVVDNLRIARKALNEGQSVINPAPAHHAIGGTTGEVIRIPGAVALAGDEFTRVTNYRSFVRAKSLRQGRELGLKGQKLAAHMEADLRAAFDPETGIATIPEALQYAERSTLSGPLGLETIGGKFASFIRETPQLQFLAPFIKAGTNIFRFTTMHTPGLARLNREARGIMAAGGEEAAVLQTKQAMASMVYLSGAYLAMSDQITGDAPGDPAVRDLWLKTHQPYSIRVGDSWVSYRRTDPFGLMLGLTADFVQFSQQQEEQDPELEQLAIAMVSSLATGVLNPTYMKGFGDFLDAFADGSPEAIGKWTRQFGSSFVPAGLNTVNMDPYFRETRSLADAIKNRIPGLSVTLDPKYDMFGEPVMNGGVGNRSALFKLKDASAQVEDELMSLGRGFAPFAYTTPQGVDLRDRESFDNGTGKSPYNRLMELIRKPNDEGKTLRQRVETVVQSERYQNASPGTADYPGGERWDLVMRERQRAYARAYRMVLQEYPSLREEVRRAQRLKRAAYRGGEDALTNAEELFGALQQSRPLKSSKLQQR